MPTSPDSFSDEENQEPASNLSETTDEVPELLPGEQSAAEPVEELSSPEPETTLPPEAQGDVNGGPLGCCLGTVIGLLLTALLTTILSVTLTNGAFLGPATLPIDIVGALLFGFLGWKIGKSIYREYELSTRQKQKLDQWEKRRLEQERRIRRR